MMNIIDNLIEHHLGYYLNGKWFLKCVLNNDTFFFLNTGVSEVCRNFFYAKF